MSDQETRSKDPRFNDIPELKCGDVRAQIAGGTDCAFIYVDACDRDGDPDPLSITEASALRDWLNKVLP